MKKVIYTIICVFFVNCLFSQQSIVISGDTQSGSSGEISYTVGLPICGMSENNGDALVIGVQQVFEYISTNSLGDIGEVGDLNMIVTPNPFIEVVKVSLVSDSFYDEEYLLWIYDMAGNVVNSFNILQKQIECNLSHLPSGIYYFALVSKDFQLKKSMKIIKQ